MNDPSPKLAPERIRFIDEITEYCGQLFEAETEGLITYEEFNELYHYVAEADKENAKAIREAETPEQTARRRAGGWTG